MSLPRKCTKSYCGSIYFNENVIIRNTTDSVSVVGDSFYYNAQHLYKESKDYYILREIVNVKDWQKEIQLKYNQPDWFHYNSLGFTSQFWFLKISYSVLLLVYLDKYNCI